MRRFTFAELYEGATGEVILDAVVDAIRYGSMIHADDVARVLEVSPRELRGAFHLLTGMRLQDALTRWRWLQAREMILSSNYSLKEVAERCGWRSVRVMNDVFCRYDTVSAVILMRRVRKH